MRFHVEGTLKTSNIPVWVCRFLSVAVFLVVNHTPERKTSDKPCTWCLIMSNSPKNKRRKHTPTKNKALCQPVSCGLTRKKKPEKPLLWCPIPKKTARCQLRPCRLCHPHGALLALRLGRCGCGAHPHHRPSHPNPKPNRFEDPTGAGGSWLSFFVSWAGGRSCPFFGGWGGGTTWIQGSHEDMSTLWIDLFGADSSLL